MHTERSSDLVCRDVDDWFNPSYLYHLGLAHHQLFTRDRIASVTDVVAGTLGGICGGLLSPHLARLADRGLAHARAQGVTAADLPPLVATLIALTVVAWWPFDITLDVYTIGARVDWIRREAWHVDSAIDLGSQALRYALCTLVVGASLERLRTSTAMAAAMLLGLAVAVVIDVGQAAMSFHPVGLADLGMQAVGCSVGGALFGVCRKAKVHSIA